MGLIYHGNDKRENSECKLERSKLAQIKKNMKLCEERIENIKTKSFKREHFLDENYERFEKYVLEFLKLYNPEHDLTDFDVDVTPYELELLGDAPAYSKSILQETPKYTQYAICMTPKMKYICKTRDIPNREIVLEMMLEDSRFWKLRHIAYENEYIYQAVDFFKVFSRRTKDMMVEDRIYEFHPLCYDFILRNYDEVFQIYEGYEDDEDYLCLTELGRNLLEISNSIFRITGHGSKFDEVPCYI